MTFEELRLRVLDWAYAKRLIEGATADKFGLKLAEEAGEVTRELCSENYKNAGMEIGDCFVVLINLCEKLNFDQQYKIKDEARRQTYESVEYDEVLQGMDERYSQKDEACRQVQGLSEYFRIKAGIPKGLDALWDAQKPLDPEFSKTVDDHFWELIDNQNPFGMDK